MGFFDSMKGLGTALLGGLGQVVQQVGPIFAEAGAQFLFNKAFPGQGGVQRASVQRINVPQTAFGAPPPRLAAPLTTPFLPTRQQTQQGTFGGLIPGFAPQQPRAPIVPHFPNQRMPGGFQTVGAMGDFLGALPELPFIDVLPQGARAGCPQLFQPTRSSVRPIPLVMVPNPVTGAPTFYKHAGRPLLFAGDLRAAKMVDKLARKARRSRPR